MPNRTTINNRVKKLENKLNPAPERLSYVMIPEDVRESEWNNWLKEHGINYPIKVYIGWSPADWDHELPPAPVRKTTK